MQLYFLYCAFLFFLCINIYQLIRKDLLNNNLVFLIISNYLLNVSTALFFGYYNNGIIASISALFLMIFATLLLFEIKKAFKKYKFFTFPYTYMTYFSFFYILFYTI